MPTSTRSSGARPLVADIAAVIQADVMEGVIPSGTWLRQQAIAEQFGVSRTPAALDLHPELQAEAAVEMLLARLSGRDADAPCYVEATLQIRASSGGWQKALDRALRVRVGWVPKRFGIGGWSGVGRPPETA